MHQGQLNTHHVEQIWTSLLSHWFPHILGNDNLILNKNTSSILAGSSQPFAFSAICMGRYFVRNL